MTEEIFIQYLKAFPSLWVSIITLFTGSYLLTKWDFFRNRFVTVTISAFLILFGLESFKNLHIMFFNQYLIPFNFSLSIAVIFLTSYVFLNYREKESVFQVIDFDTNPEESEYPIEEDIEDLESGYSYLIESKDRERPFNLFRNLISDVPGLCFSREHPLKLREKYKLQETPAFWFSDEDSDEKEVNPTRMSLLRDTIFKFADENKESAVLVSDLEYLFFKNNFRKVMHLLEDVNDNSAEFEHNVLIFSVDPNALEKRELAIVEDEFDKIIR